MQARIVLLSGASGTGKSTLSRMLAENSTYERAAHMHTDDFYQYICKGYIAPWLNGSGDQNETLIESVAASAKRLSEGGYEVFVDGVVGPWFLKPWLRIAREGMDVRYIVLRPSEQATISRAMDRAKRDSFPMSEEVISSIWQNFADLGNYEGHVIDTTGQTVQESVALIQKGLLETHFCRL